MVKEKEIDMVKDVVKEAEEKEVVVKQERPPVSYATVGNEWCALHFVSNLEGASVP